MRIIALVQAYNEEDFVIRNLSAIYDLVDQFVITEGCLSPHGNLPKTSTDKTWDLLSEFKKNHDKVILRPCYGKEEPSREEWEGQNKNMMLEAAEPSDGDILYILDADEFLLPESLSDIIDYFRANDEAECVRLKEKQFAYGFKWFFPSSHPRFLRYKKGRKFRATNNFFDEEENITRKVTREFGGLFHFCWSKHPQRIREKVLSFNRPSFTSWYNNVYLVWPDSLHDAYQNNRKIPPYHGEGFAEGMNEKLQPFKGKLHGVVEDLNYNWLDYIKEHKGELKI